MRRGNRHLVGVVMGGRSGGSRDAIMRNLLAENLEKAAGKRTVAAITERGPLEANVDVAEDQARSRPTQIVQVQGAMQVASAVPDEAAPMRPAPPVTKPSIIANAAAALPPAQAKPEPAPLTSGVIQTQAISAIPGSSEPMKPVRVKTVQVRAGQVKLASADPAQPATPVTNTIPLARSAVPETSGSVVARAELNKAEMNKIEMPPQPANHGTGRGVLGVLPASSVNTAPAMASADPSSRLQSQALQQNGAIKPVAVRSGWIIQVGALETEGEARQRLEAARDQARGMLGKADPFTEPVVAKGEKKLFRARFAGLDRDQAEAVCRTLKRSDISCIAIRN
jgi:D-alanyl-D-alanine carboxypeptidase